MLSSIITSRSQLLFLRRRYWRSLPFERGGDELAKEQESWLEDAVGDENERRRCIFCCRWCCWRGEQRREEERHGGGRRRAANRKTRRSRRQGRGFEVLAGPHKWTNGVFPEAEGHVGCSTAFWRERGAAQARQHSLRSSLPISSFPLDDDERTNESPRSTFHLTSNLSSRSQALSHPLSPASEFFLLPSANTLTRRPIQST